MKVCPSVSHPPHHDIRVYHPTVGRETEAHPSRRTDVNCKCDRALRSAEVPAEHVRISIPVVEGGTEGVSGGKVTQNEGQQSQQTQQTLHCGGQFNTNTKARPIRIRPLQVVIRFLVRASPKPRGGRAGLVINPRRACAARPSHSSNTKKNI